MTRLLVRKNGCQPPFHPKQVVSIIQILVSLIFYPVVGYNLINNILENNDTNNNNNNEKNIVETSTKLTTYNTNQNIDNHELKVAFIGITLPIFLTSALFLAIFGITLMLTDPFDTGSIPENESEQMWCPTCIKIVSKDVLHCKYCNKCILRLDHHCFFVNNCVGKRNYKIYIWVLGTGFLTSACGVILSTLLSIWYIQHLLLNNNKDNHHHIFNNDTTNITIVCFSSVLGLLHVAGVWFIGDLIYLHLKLYHRKETTLEYSRYLRNRTHELQLEREQRRISEASLHGSVACCSPRYKNKKVYPIDIEDDDERQLDRNYSDTTATS